MFPEFIVKRVSMSTLLVDRGLSAVSFNERFRRLPLVVEEYLSSIESGFVSNNSEEFIEFLEERLGKIKFTKSFAIRIRPGGDVRLFIDGKEIFER